MELNIDSDGIVVDLHQSWLDLIAAKHGLRATKAEILDWEMAKVAKFKSLNPKYVVDEALATPGLFRNAKPIPGALEALRALKDRGHLIRILTATPHHVDLQVKTEKTEWYAEHAPFIDELKFASGPEKINTPGHVFIDDRPDTLIAYKQAHPDALVIGIEYPYNKKVVEHGVLLVPAYDRGEDAWKLILSLIETHAQALAERDARELRQVEEALEAKRQAEAEAKAEAEAAKIIPPTVATEVHHAPTEEKKETPDAETPF